MSFEKKEASLLSYGFGISPLPDLLFDRMSRMKEQQDQVQLFRADLDLLLKRYNVEKSLIGRLAAGYTNLRWWYKGLIGLGLMTIAALIGVGFSLALTIVLPVVTLILYCLFTYLFYDYTLSDEARFKRISESLVNREGEMNQSILELQKTEEEIFELIEKLRNFDQSYQGTAEQFKEQIKILEEEVQNYQKVALQFEELKSSMSLYVDGMQKVEMEFSFNLNELEFNINHQFNRIKQSTECIEETAKKIKLNSAILKHNHSLPREEKEHPMKQKLDDLTSEFRFRTEEELEEEQDQFKKSVKFLAQTDRMVTEMSLFLEENKVNLKRMGIENNVKCANGGIALS